VVVSGLRPLRVIARPAFKRRHENPYTSALYAGLFARGVRVDEFSPHNILRRKYDIFHVHWPEIDLSAANLAFSLARLTVLLASIRVARWRGARLIWTVHNLRSHDRRYPRTESWFWRQFIPHVDGFVCLSESGLEAARDRFPELRNVPGFVVPHGDYRESYANFVSRAEARETLGIAPAGTVIAFFGQVRPYKNVVRLVQVARELSDPELTILIAGKPVPSSFASEVLAEAGDDSRVSLHLRHIPDDDVQIYLNAADLIVLPYRDILNSGTALLSLTFSRPVLGPARGAFPELQRLVGPEWIRTFSGNLAVEDLKQAVVWARSTPRPPTPVMTPFEWTTIAGATHAAFMSVGRQSLASERASG
jgi:beta-1,4-mannosyltransferase